MLMTVAKFLERIDFRRPPFPSAVRYTNSANRTESMILRYSKGGKPDIFCQFDEVSNGFYAPERPLSLVIVLIAHAVLGNLGGVLQASSAGDGERVVIVHINLLATVTEIPLAQPAEGKAIKASMHEGESDARRSVCPVRTWHHRRFSTNPATIEPHLASLN